MKRTPEQLLSDIAWVQDSALYNRAILELLGSLGKKPFSIDKAQFLHELMNNIAENDAAGMVRPPAFDPGGLVMLRKQAGG